MSALKKSLIIANLLVLQPLGALASEKSLNDDWRLQKVAISRSIKVQTSTQGAAQPDIVHLGAGETVEVPSELTAAEIREAGLTASEASEVNALSRELYLSAVQTVMSENFNGSLIASGAEAYTIVPKSVELNRGTIVFNPVLSALSTPLEGEAPLSKPKFMARVKSFLKFLKQATLISTLDQFRTFRKQMKAVRGDEVGLSLNLKIEMQLGVGALSFSKSGAFLLDFGYNKKTHTLSVTTRVRKESLGEGTAFPAAKFEVRAYKMTITEDQGDSQKGQAWYPPFIPLATLVGDTSDRYVAFGGAVSANAGDWIIPGGFLLNSVNNFEEKQKRYTLFRIPDAVFETYRAVVDTILRRPRSCQALFG